MCSHGHPQIFFTGMQSHENVSTRVKRYSNNSLSYRTIPISSYDPPDRCGAVHVDDIGVQGTWLWPLSRFLRQFASLHCVAEWRTNCRRSPVSRRVRSRSVWVAAPQVLVPARGAQNETSWEPTCEGMRLINCKNAALHDASSRRDSSTANSLSAFRQQLKCNMFQQSFADIIMWHFLTVTPTVVLAVVWVCRFLTAHQHIKGHLVPCNG